MRPRNQSARDRLYAVLSRQSPASAAALAKELGVSVPTLHRLLGEAGPHVLAAGKARRARYALRRSVRGAASDFPVYEIDREGRASQAGTLTTIFPNGTWLNLAAMGWPVPAESQDGWWSDLPYPFHDMRPQGYMGRQFARLEHRRLDISADPSAWSGDDVLIILSQSGADVSGNLILGDRSAEQWTNARLNVAPVPAGRVGAVYATAADEAVAAGVLGSSAAGEFPKFTAAREHEGSLTPHVIVKFSGAEASSAVTRWADLLVCEHLALEAAATMPGVDCARSRIVQAAGRTFLEVERFDRHGLFGRSRLASLDTLNGALVGAMSTDWPALGEALAGLSLVSEGDLERIRYLWWFGRLIANTDMHLGNLSFRADVTLSLAPTYDMVPMLYAPLPGGEVPPREFDPELPLPADLRVWMVACTAAIGFWARAAGDHRISEGFRAISQGNATRLETLHQMV